MEEVELVLGKAIQEARQQAGLTQQELCQRANLSYSTLAKIERGAIKTPSVFTVASIASTLGVSLDALLGGVVGTGAAVVSAKRKTTSGISFLYVDINGCLVHFFHGAFTRLAHETGISSDVIESTFWHYNDAVCRGEMTLEEFNSSLAEKLGLQAIQWADYYMDAIVPINEMHDLLREAAKHFRVGLLSNIMPGFIEEMMSNGSLPAIKYDAIIDSSQVKYIKPDIEIYKVAESQSGVSGSEILFIDDSRTNLMAAEQLGWKVMWFDDMRPSESVSRIRSVLEL